MRFANPEYLLLLLLVPILVGLFLVLSYQQRRAWEVLADPSFKQRIVPGYSPGRRKIKFFLKILALLFLILSLMGPQWGSHEEEVRMRGVNIMLLVDVSDSMLAQDLQPSRLERERRKLKDLLKMLSGDRVGLVAFAGRSFLLSPLTADYGTLDRYIDDLSPETIPVKGTDLAGALSLALKSLPEGDEGKAIVLLTDGEDHSEKMEKVLQEIKSRNIKLFVLGVGTPEGAPIPEKGGGFKSTQVGEMVVSKLKEGFLKDLALETEGAYARTVSSDNDLQELYVKGIRGVMDPSDLRVTRKKVWENRFYWPLAFALFFLLLERVIPEGGPLSGKKLGTETAAFGLPSREG